MRSPKFVIAMAGSAALVAAPLAAAPMAAASETGSNSGSSAAAGPAREAGTTTVSKKFKAYDQPTGKYVSKSCAIDLSGIADFTPVSELSGCDTTVTVSPTAEKRSVPNSWLTWGAPPDTEDEFPHILLSVSPQLTLSFDGGGKHKYGGVEVEPDPFEDHTFTASYYKGQDGSGKLLGEVTATASGEAGAKLLGAKVKKGFESIVITSNEGVAFSVAQIRS